MHGAGLLGDVLGERMSHCRIPKPYILKKISPFSATGRGEGGGRQRLGGKCGEELQN